MDKSIWEHCNRCSGKKRHEVLYHKKIEWSEELSDDFGIAGSDTYDLLQCLGCESVQFRHKKWFSEDYDPETGQPEITIRQYPPPTFRTSPKWLTDLLISDIDESIQGFILEIYIALQNDAPRLAVLGIRALLETIMIDKIGDKGTFVANVAAFEEEGFISKKQKEVIKPILEAGHAAMHRGYKPNKNEVVRLMDVTESIIETIYMNEQRIKGLSDKIPPKKRKSKNG
jgi:hypothetical protein